ncbi:MAG: transketolase, partial [bacterium]|nr:transketolase [bacterium]
KTYEKRIKSFGWNTIVVDGHDLKKVQKAFTLACSNNLLPTMIIAKTIKGKGVSFMENKDGWHGKPVPKDMLETALKELGKVDLNIRGKINIPEIPTSLKLRGASKNQNYSLLTTHYNLDSLVATREAYGNALVHLGTNENIVVLDGETSNSTYAEKFKKIYPDRFFEMYIAEQNMISVALGFSKIGYIPFSSSFAAFLTRAFDQIRIAQYSKPNIKICGSHAGVSIGEDGPSQMALEDLAMVRSILESVVFYPSDAISTEKIMQLMYQQNGLIYIRTTREKTSILYDEKEKFEIGGSKIHKVVGVGRDRPVNALIIAAGITLHEALKAQKELAKENITIVVMDCYCVKPIDVQSINRLAKQTKNIIVVEDHYPAGGIGEAVLSSLLSINYHPSSDSSFTHLCVHKLPRSGKLAELLRYEEIDAGAIIKTVKNLH